MKQDIVDAKHLCSHSNTTVPCAAHPAADHQTIYTNQSKLISQRYDTTEQFNVDSKASVASLI